MIEITPEMIKAARELLPFHKTVRSLTDAEISWIYRAMRMSAPDQEVTAPPKSTA
jgi:hypothetical protein